MKRQIRELKQVLNLMIEPELKESIAQLCEYLFYKYGEYYVDDFDDEEESSKPFSVVNTDSYVVTTNRKRIVCKNLYKKDGELFLVPVDCDPEIAEQSKLIALSSIKQKNHLIAVLNALIKAVDGLHNWEDSMFGEDE
jgi:hypothetical protein